MTRRWTDYRMLFYILALLILVYLALTIAASVGSYTDLEITLHGRTAHQNQNWNPNSIQEYFASGKCKPQIDLCENDKEIHWCEIHDGFSIALVIGSTVRQIITGYGASTSYWANRCPQT